MPEVAVGDDRLLGRGRWPRRDPRRSSGASHFLEHLLFKGTADRSARADRGGGRRRGGEMNAFTAREHTAFYVRLPSAETGLRLDLLGDVVARPAFRPDEVESERQVILEELLLSEDEPDERVHTLCMEALFPRPPARPGGARQRRDDRGDGPRRHRRVPRRRTTGRPTWSWSRPATSTTTRWSAGVEAGFTSGATAGVPRRGDRRTTGRVDRLVLSPADRAGPPHLRLAGLRPARPRPVRARRAEPGARAAGMSSRLFHEIRETPRAWRTPSTRTRRSTPTPAP